MRLDGRAFLTSSAWAVRERFLRMYQKRRPPIMAMRMRPPTTPPAIAPAFVRPSLDVACSTGAVLTWEAGEEENVVEVETTEEEGEDIGAASVVVPALSLCDCP